VAGMKKAIKALKAKYPGSVVGVSEHAPVEVISTGSLGLDRALGVGGYARGRIAEVFGEESSGKTTLCLHAVASAQVSGLGAAFIDAEHSLDPSYARALGVDWSELLVVQPDSGEQALGAVRLLCESGEVAIVVVDSVAGLTPKAELEGDYEDTHIGAQARMMSKALRSLTSVAYYGNTLILFTNQTRHKIGVVFGSRTTTPGGNALKFYSSVRLDVRRVGQVKAGERTVGSRTRVKVVKNKLAVPWEQCEFDILWGKGISREAEVLELAVGLGKVEQKGAWFSFRGNNVAQGRLRVVQRLRDDPELMAAIEEEVFRRCG